MSSDTAIFKNEFIAYNKMMLQPFIQIKYKYTYIRECKGERLRKKQRLNLSQVFRLIISADESKKIYIYKGNKTKKIKQLGDSHLDL